MGISDIWSYISTNAELIKNLVTSTAILVGVPVGLYGLLLNHKRTKVAQSGHVTDRFREAVTQLGHENMSVRIGGLYSLKRIIKDAEDGDRENSIDVICAYIRSESPDDYSENDISRKRGIIKVSDDPITINYELPLDKIIACEIIFIDRHNVSRTRAVYLLLSRIFLRNEFYKKIPPHTHISDNKTINLQGAILNGAKLNGLLMKKVVLNESKLISAELTQSDLTGASFKNATMTDANLRGANLREADLVKADLEGANLQGVRLNRFMVLSQTMI